jgi:hypothetical protein
MERISVVNETEIRKVGGERNSAAYSIKKLLPDYFR